MTPMVSASQSVGTTDMMGGGMEHPMNTLAVPPLIDPRLLYQFCTAVQQYSVTAGRQSEADAKVAELKARLDNLTQLAQLCRLAVLGHPNSFGRVLDELLCIAVDFPADPLDGDPYTELEEEDEPDDRYHFGAVFDLLAGAAFVSKDDPDQRDRLIVGIIRAVEDAICYPLAFSDEAAAYVGEGDGSLSSSHVSRAIGNATTRIIERDTACDPLVGADIRMRLEQIALKWMAANPVTEMFRALTGPRWTRALESIDPDDVNVGDRVTLTLRDDCAAPPMKPTTATPNTAPRAMAGMAAAGGAPGSAAGSAPDGLYVLFCPSQEATILKATATTLVVEVPRNARTGPIALVRQPDVTDVKYLLVRFACEYPEEWSDSLFGVIKMGIWAYADAFGEPLVEITQVPRSVTVTAHDANGPVGVGRSTRVNQPVYINYEVTPPGSEANTPLQVHAPGGQVTQPKPGTVVYTPTQPGINTVDLSWGDVTTSVTINATPGTTPAPTPQTKGKTSKKRSARDE